MNSKIFLTAIEWSSRVLYMLLGISLTLVGLASLVLPFIPTTTTLLASSFFLIQSLPQLQNCLRKLPIVGRLIKYLDGTRVLTTTARSGILAYIWANFSISCASLYGIGLANSLIVGINIICCVLGTIFVQKFHVERKRVSQTIGEDRAIASHPTRRESQVLDSVNAISGELNAALDCGQQTQPGLPVHDPQPLAAL